MSINVTVTGNPVSIKRGKMVTFDPYNEKKEFEKRRLMRLEQVRQQSKEFAENVRNKVKKEKKKQMSEIESEGKERLKNWQNRKLLELQNQYRNALDEIGIGHKNAEELLDEECLLTEQHLRNDKQAKERGKAAATKLQIQKNEDNYRKAMPIQQKQIVRDIENTRATLVSSINKQKNYVKSKCKKQKPSANIDITIPTESDLSDNVTMPNQLSDIPEEQSELSEELCECSESSQEHTSSDVSPEGQYNSENVTETHNIENSYKEKDKSASLHSQTKFKPYHQVLEEHRNKIEQFKANTSELPLDTRISDRIKQRKLTALQPDFCDFDNNVDTQVNMDKIKNLQKRISESKYNQTNDKICERDPLELSSDECMCSKLSKKCPCKYQVINNIDNKQSSLGKASTSTVIRDSQQKLSGQHLQENAKSATIEIPTKPAIKLKEVGKSVQSTVSNDTEYQKVHYYDFPNRFEKDVASNSQVERITADSIEVLPNSVSEVEWQKKMKQRDKEAQIRGRNALEKEKIQKSYEEMMKKLPILQRKEKITQIGSDKPEYHMSQERLQDRENQKQAKLENVYLREISDIKPKLVTLPSRKHNILTSEEPFHILEGDDSRVLNLGNWDDSSKPKTMFSTEEVQEIIRAFTVQNPEDRRVKLKHLLKNLKMQKEQLLNEIKLLPKDDSINALISDLNSFTDNKRAHKSVKQKRKRKKDLLDSEESYDKTESDNKCQSKILKEKQKRSDSNQRKYRSGVLVLQNMSTQTTPVAKSKSTTSTSTSTLDINNDVPIQQVSKEVSNICEKQHTPCDCNKENAESSEELCKIFIKLHDNQNPKVEVLKSSRPEKDEVDKGVIEATDRTQREHKSKSREDKKTSSPKILVKEISPKPIQESIKKPVATKSVATETEKKKRLKAEIIIPTKKVDQEIDGKTKQRPQLRNESWKDHLSKNSMSTSSTSYMSPPDFSRPNTTASTDISQQSFYNLRKKPQQKNVQRSPKLENSYSTVAQQNLNESNLQLINYIKKLLSMSKVSIDELGVSSSDVQTPSQSIIETESNNPLAALHNIVKYINFKAVDAARMLSVSPDPSHPPPNSLYSSLDGTGTVEDHTENISKKDISSGINQNTGGITSQYADITDSCTRRIANLASMIHKLREEKYQMLQKTPVESCACNDSVSPSSRRTPISDKNNSTRYFEFPPSGEKSKDTNSSVSTDEEELHRRLIDIDMSLAEKLKRFRQTNDDGSKENSDISDKSGKEQLVSTVDKNDRDVSQPDHDLTSRLRKLLAESYTNETSDVPHLPQPPVPSSKDNEAPFVPLLLDIPKLPILELQPAGQPLTQSFGGYGKKCPPPSKGLITAKRFNGNISLLPHELSTIAEADSQLSTRMSPNTSKIMTSPVKDVIFDLSLTTDVESLIDDSLKSKNSNKSQGTKNKILKVESTNANKASSHIGTDKKSLDSKSFKTLDNSDNGSLTCNDLTCSSLSSSSSLKKSSSSSDMETIEAMLRSIGMDWAIPTLHKTQEALALTSSSSSSNVCLNKNDSSKSSCSEVSLKQFLKKQMIKKISSSSLKCDSSPCSFLQELSEISAINPNNSSAEKTKRRTSTPVLSSKSSSKSKDEQPFFPGTSDISSVRNTSGDNTTYKNSQEKHTFHTLDGDYSVTKSLI